MGLACILFLAAWRKRPRAILLAMASIGLLSAAAGCNSANKTLATPVNPGTPAGSYVVTITGTSENLQQTSNVFVSIR